MKILKTKQPSAPGKGHLGQQTLGKRFAVVKRINNTTVMQRYCKVTEAHAAWRYSK